MIVEFTVSKKTVLQDGIRQQDVVMDESGLEGKYVMVATGHIYADPEGNHPVTMVNGTGQWNHCAYTNPIGEAYALTDDGDVWYRDEGTEVTVIYALTDDVWNAGLPSKELMSSWGNPTTGNDNGKYDENLYMALFGSYGNVWSGSESFIGYGWAVNLANGYWYKWIKATIYSNYRVQSAIFR